jgi:hypothetical protein
VNMYNENEIDNTMVQWMTSKRFTPDATANAAVRLRVLENLERLGGFVSVSSWERAYLELQSEKAIPEFRGSIAEQPAAAPAISPVVAFIESPRTSASELRRRYNSDPTFRQQYDAYEKSKGQNQQQPGVVSLTAEQYHSLPAQTIVVRYRREPGFKLAVDKLIAEGRI